MIVGRCVKKRRKHERAFRIQEDQTRTSLDRLQEGKKDVGWVGCATSYTKVREIRRKTWSLCPPVVVVVCYP